MSDYINIRVIEVENIVFGGLREIRLFGCGPGLYDDTEPAFGAPTTRQTISGTDWITQRPSENIVSPTLLGIHSVILDFVYPHRAG